MSKQFAQSTQKQLRTSKIQVEVKELTLQSLSKNTTAQLNSDADGGDLTNE